MAAAPSCVQALLLRGALRAQAGRLKAAAADFRALERAAHERLADYPDLSAPAADPARALDASRRLLRIEPKLPWAWVFHAFALRRLLRYNEAVAAAARAARLAPRSAALRAVLARARLTGQERYRGVADMRAAVRLEPRWGWLRCWLGEALRHAGRPREALRELSLGLRLQPGYVRGRAWRGAALLELGRTREALRELDRALLLPAAERINAEARADFLAWVYEKRSLARRRLGLWAGALADAESAHRLAPHYVYGDARARGDAAQAVARELEAAARLLPRNAAARGWLAWNLAERGILDRALDEAERALRLRRTGWLVALRGRILWDLRRRKEAEATFESAIAADPGYAPAWAWRARARRFRGRLAAAVADFDRALELDPRAAAVYAGRGEALLKLGRLEAGRRDLDAALALCDEPAEFWAWRAECRRLAGDPSGAVADADEALRREPGLVWALLTRSLAQGARRRFKAQRRDFRRAVESLPEEGGKTVEMR